MHYLFLLDALMYLCILCTGRNCNIQLLHIFGFFIWLFCDCCTDSRRAFNCGKIYKIFNVKIIVTQKWFLQIIYGYLILLGKFNYPELVQRTSEFGRIGTKYVILIMKLVLIVLCMVPISYWIGHWCQMFYLIILSGGRYQLSNNVVPRSWKHIIN